MKKFIAEVQTKHITTGQPMLLTIPCRAADMIAGITQINEHFQLMNAQCEVISMKLEEE